ncbi:uncharacterized protein E0L32_010518 [Thyridium curvatum]|uniref:Xylose isomerase-like TIM barrel domain-containing protein n=1 Tax=Thyridium curvatum TaxID=1093900 RepID=A0A507ASE8_9PEZI|nr:uncharacterized protein E0L32_010518 [Thyridium curvatum]TPX07831.1 hypothetical protein E0L32_010518 [Thyridium curvatum]
MPPALANKWAVATISLGQHPSHTLERKLRAARDHGFQGVELTYSDLAQHAAAHAQPLLASAAQVRALASALSLSVISLAALKNFEGNRAAPLADRLALAREWAEVAAAAGAGCVQVPSQFLPASAGDEDTVVRELRALADLAAGYGLDVAYEAVAFAAHNALWQDGLRIQRAVGRPNFKLCMDSFHVHARLWGDACASDGRRAGGGEVLRESMAEFVRACPKESVLYMQLSDASRFDPPLARDDPALYVPGLEVPDPRLLWSRTRRPFPLEEPGYFPMVEIAHAWLVEYGWQGWMSLEGFLAETKDEQNGPEVMAARARKSIDNLLGQLSRS